MSPTNSNQQAWQEQRLKHQLEIQSHQIERVFSQHQVAAQVSGGQVNSHSISFSLQTQLARGWDYLRDLKRDLMASLGVGDLHVGWENGQLQLQITRPEEPPVALLSLLPLLPELPPITAVLGLDEVGHPLLLDFVSPDIEHVLVTGVSSAGKTSLLRTVAMSLALTNRQAQLQMVVLAPDTAVAHPYAPQTNSSYDILEPLSYLPHLIAPVLYNLADVKEMLAFLVQELAYRREQAINTPALIVLVDRADLLLAASDEALQDNLTELLQYGATADIYLVLAVNDPTTAVVNNSWRANLPIRLVGRAKDAQEAETAADVANTQAEYLLGQGDFLAIVDDSVTYFQAAYIDHYDLHLTVQKLHHARRKTLLAQPYNIRPNLPPVEDEVEQAFLFEGGTVTTAPTPKSKPKPKAKPKPAPQPSPEPPPEFIGRNNGKRKNDRSSFTPPPDWYAADDIIPFH